MFLLVSHMFCEESPTIVSLVHHATFIAGLSLIYYQSHNCRLVPQKQGRLVHDILLAEPCCVWYRTEAGHGGELIGMEGIPSPASAIEGFLAIFGSERSSGE